jgi:hypothetical protein
VALSLQQIAERLKWTSYDIYGLLHGARGNQKYDKSCLVATGHAKITEDQDGYQVYYLTARGQKADFKKWPFIAGRNPNPAKE